MLNGQSFRDSSCTRKRRYASKHQAKLGIKELKTCARGRLVKLSAYKCIFCDGFHLGGTRKDLELKDLEQEMK